MINRDVYDKACRLFRQRFGMAHRAAAYAPGRVEVLGNHTDYNEGFVLSAAIDCGTFFLVAPSGNSKCTVLAGDNREESAFEVKSPAPSRKSPWANYVKGVFAGITRGKRITGGFNAVLLGNIPIGAGLSSSAALEMSAGLALAELYSVRVRKLDLARIGQAAEHKYAGVKCGLLDQISSLYGKRSQLVMSDFRALKAGHVPMPKDARFIMCNTHAKHALVDGEYNERRRSCEKGAEFFSGVLNRKITALRDVRWTDWMKHSHSMSDVLARRAAHIIGENARVLAGRKLLRAGKLKEFGRLMFESHASSRVYFENSCEELDFLVATAAKTDGALGARLSGGGFGGSAVILTHSGDVGTVSAKLASAYRKKFRSACDVKVITPSDGARLV